MQEIRGLWFLEGWLRKKVKKVFFKKNEQTTLKSYCDLSHEQDSITKKPKPI